MVPRGSHRVLELCSSEVTEPIDLVLDCNSEHFGMLDNVHRRWSCDSCFRSGSFGSDCGERFSNRGTSPDMFLGHPSPRSRTEINNLYLSFGVGRRCSGFDLRRRKVVVKIEEIYHVFHNLRIIAGVVRFLGGFRAALHRLQLDGAAFAFLPHVNMAFISEPVVAHAYLESTFLERGLEVAGLSHENDLVEFELVRSADQFAVEKLFRDADPRNNVRFETICVRSLDLTQPSLPSRSGGPPG